MKPAKIYQQYIWIVNTLRQYKKLSLEELNKLWMKDQVIDGRPLAHVVIRAYGITPNYIRTLPLHASQKEIQSTEEYTDFSYDIRPTYDFINELCSYHKGLEVLEPQDFREKIRDYLVETLSRY